MTPQTKRTANTVLIAALMVLVYQWATGGSVLDVVAPATPDKVVYVYDRNDGGVPAGVHGAINELKRRGMDASVYEVGTTDGTGQTPEQHRVADAKARELGTPLLVVQSGAEVVGTLTAPTDKQAVLEAAQ